MHPFTAATIADQHATDLRRAADRHRRTRQARHARPASPHRRPLVALSAVRLRRADRRVAVAYAPCP
jgi:hypothetical protein